jgi:uncharacterized protein YjbI with pentapeptide repeats
LRVVIPSKGHARSWLQAAGQRLRLALRVAAISLPLLVPTAQSPRAAELSAREVVSALFRAAPGAAPDFSGKDLRRLDLAGIDFKGARLAKANLFGADLSGANLAKADLAGAILDRATIVRATFAGANLSEATIRRPNLFTTLEAMRGEVPSFAGATLARAHLSGRFDYASFRTADLTGAHFGPKDPRSEELITGRVELTGCDFSDATLRDANLSHSGAQYAKFIRADLRGANLAHANLKAADFTGADLDGADFTGAVLDGANFTGAKGLDRARGLQEGLRRDGAAPPSVP